jgi:release factor glutamine methyltransferase
VEGFDISQDALRYAHINEQRLATKVRLFQADLFGPLEAIGPPNSVDILVSNPPYIPANERDTLAKHVREFEPELALFAPETGVFDFYRQLVELAAYALTKHGVILAEIHAPLADQVALNFNQLGKSIIQKDVFDQPRIALVIR